MNCKRCNFEMSDDSVYCGRCGSRVDGKRACPACGKDICEDYTYCNYCGARVDGKQVCECGNVFEGNFCFVCGKGAAKSKKAAKSQGGNLSFVFTKIAEGVLMLGALLAFIFVFFIGAGVKVPEGLSSILEGAEIELGKNTNIFYFFGQFFKDMQTLEQASFANEWFNDLLFRQAGLYGALGITVSALTLLSVLTFSVLAIVFYALGWAGKTKVDFSKFALAAIVCFFVGALAYYAILYASISANAVGVINIKVASTLNGGTTAALICIAVLILHYFVLRVLARGKKAIGFAPIFKMVASITVVAFGLVVAFVAINQGLTIGVKDSEGEMVFTTGFLQSNILWISTFANAFDNTIEGYGAATTAFEISTALFSIAQITQILALAFTGVAIINSFKNGAEDKKSAVVLFAALAAGAALFTLVLSCIGYGCFVNAYEFFAETKITTNFASEIVAFVFSLLLLGGAIAVAIVEKKTE